MKYILTFIIVATLISCGSNYDETNYITDKPAIVLNKTTDVYIGKGVNTKTYKLYVFDGYTSEWYETNINTYNKYNAGDTLKNVTLTTIRTEYCND